MNFDQGVVRTACVGTLLYLSFRAAYWPFVSTFQYITCDFSAVGLWMILSCLVRGIYRYAISKGRSV